jgi:hypothetical protein
VRDLEALELERIDEAQGERGIVFDEEDAALVAHRIGRRYSRLAAAPASPRWKR